MGRRFRARLAQDAVFVRSNHLGVHVTIGGGNSRSVVKEEVFGPGLTITPYGDEDDALGCANDSEYGLGGSVWSSNAERAATVAARLDSGGAWVNQHPAMGPNIPFGGVKGSGIGVELGRLGLEEYTSIQVLNVKLS